MSFSSGRMGPLSLGFLFLSHHLSWVVLLLVLVRLLCGTSLPFSFKVLGQAFPQGCDMALFLLILFLLIQASPAPS